MPTEASTHHEPPTRAAAAWVVAFLGGFALAVQSRCNGTLGHSTPEPMLAAVWSFGTGLILLILASGVPVFRSGVTDLRRAVRDGRLQWWECLGGLLGGLFVATQASTVGTLGVAVFTVTAVGGQTAGGVLVDHFGIGPKGRSPVTVVRVLAALVAVVGVGITVSASMGERGVALGPAIIVAVMGCLTQVQGGLNGRVAARTGSPFASTIQNFLVGTVTLVVVSGARLVLGVTHFGVPHDVPWWAWCGAPLGIAYVAATAWATRHLNVLLFGLVALCGQLVASLMLDLLDPATRGLVDVRMLLGMGVTAAGALGAGLWGRTRPAR